MLRASLENGRSAEEVEAFASKEGVELAAEWVRDKPTSSDMPEVCFQAARRDRNRAAHELAQLAERTIHTAMWRSQVPRCIEQLIAHDCNLIE
ncbi:hypothetical protein EJB05_15220, partial [Eragrostis curvula]